MNYGVKGPFGWIQSGTVDIDAHFSVPVDLTSTEEGEQISQDEFAAKLALEWQMMREDISKRWEEGSAIVPLQMPRYSPHANHPQQKVETHANRNPAFLLFTLCICLNQTSRFANAL